MSQKDVRFPEQNRIVESHSVLLLTLINLVLMQKNDTHTHTHTHFIH